MTMHMSEALGYVGKHGYGLLFGWVVAEQLGAPLPAVPILVAAGVLSATGELSIAAAILLAVVACLIGDSAWYAFGKLRGTEVLRVLCRISIEPETCVRRSEDFIGRHGARALLYSKFIPGIGTLAVPLASISGVSALEFALYDIAGCFAYVGAYMGIGWLVGDRIDRLDQFTSQLATLAIVLAILGVIGILAWRIHQRRKLLRDLRTARITPEELMELYERGPQPYVIDLRHALDALPDPRMLPGAVRMTPDEVTARHQEIPRDREVVLYCT